MVTEITIPNLGLTMEEARIVEWLKKEGESVAQGEPVAVIETDKSTFEITASTGLLHVEKQAGEAYPVGTVIAWTADNPAEYERRRSAKGQAETARSGAEQPVSQTSSPQAAAPAERKGKPPSSPSARRLAREHNVDLSRITGTGPGERIVREDVEAHLRNVRRAPETPPAPVPGFLKKAAQVLPVTGVRALIQERMQKSLRDSAQLTISMEAQASELWRLRKTLAQQPDASFRISYNAIFLKALGHALKQYPLMNSSSDGHQLTLWQSVNVGIATEVDEGLVVPVVRDVDQKDLIAIQQEIESLVQTARAGKRTPDQMQGGTFTLTNLGSLGVDVFTPILNPPEVGILGVGRIADRPVVIDSTMQVAKTVVLSLTFDHRVVDGAYAARFLGKVRDYVQEPFLLYLSESRRPSNDVTGGKPDATRR
ncbi:MAG: dihydrolipoamide acetyltransferase family protein [Acidobacteriota bacterium]